MSRRDRVLAMIDNLHHHREQVADNPNVGAALLVMARMDDQQLVELGDQWLLDGMADVAPVAWGMSNG